MSTPVRVYYKTRDPFVISRPDLFTSPFDPADFGAVSLVEDETSDLTNPEKVFARLNADDRSGGQSVRSLSTGDVVEIHGRMQQCLPLGWREVTDADAEVLRARFGIVSAPPAWGLADAVRRAEGMLEMVQDALGETSDHPWPDPNIARQWVVGARAVLAPYVTAWPTATQSVPASFRFTLHDVNEDSAVTQDVLIFLSEQVEIVVPRPGQTPSHMDPDHELAVARVELCAGDVRAMLWDYETLEAADDAQVTVLFPADVSATTQILPENQRC